MEHNACLMLAILIMALIMQLHAWLRVQHAALSVYVKHAESDIIILRQ